MNMRCRTVSLLILEHESHSKMNEWSISLNSIDFSWIAWWVKVKEATEGHTNCHIQAIISTMAYYAFQCEVAVCALRILHGLWIACVWIEGGSCIDINIITCNVIPHLVSPHWMRKIQTESVRHQRLECRSGSQLSTQARKHTNF